MANNLRFSALYFLNLSNSLSGPAIEKKNYTQEKVTSRLIPKFYTSESCFTHRMYDYESTL